MSSRVWYVLHHFERNGVRISEDRVDYLFLPHREQNTAPDEDLITDALRFKGVAIPADVRVVADRVSPASAPVEV
jgi:hypothetical protein